MAGGLEHSEGQTSSGVVVFTSIYGGYDDLKDPVPQTMAADWVCVSDERLESEVWEVRQHLPCGHPRLDAKYFRTHPHQVAPDHEISIWIDGSFKVNNPTFVADVVHLLGDADALFFPHRWRDCIYDEAKASEGLPKYEGHPVAKQVEEYRAEGMPEHWGLVETGCLVRRHMAADIVALDEMWWRENIRWTYQDQLSLPYLLWQQGNQFVWMPFDMNHQPWFSIELHNRDD